MSKQRPIHILMVRLKSLTLPQQIHYLRALVALEKPHSVRRNELQSLLEGKLTRQLRKEVRGAA
jgi:hypothetical protein